MMRIGRNFIILISGALLCGVLIGCSSGSEVKSVPRVVYITVPLDVPEKPELPKLMAEDLSCLGVDTKEVLLKRDALLKNYTARLIDVIKSTHQ